jgi:hypothetical protein
LIVGLCALASACATIEEISADAGTHNDISVRTRCAYEQDFENSVTMSWGETTTHVGLTVNFTGFGSVGVVAADTQVLRLVPQASTSAGETHAALVTTTQRFDHVDLSLRMRTVQQLRRGSPPNTWETAWVLWNFRSNTSFYYFTLKTNGWELGKADSAYPGAQRFLRTGSLVSDPLTWHRVRVTQRNATSSVWIDGASITTFTDEERALTGGSIGLYTEDAEVIFDDITACAL